FLVKDEGKVGLWTRDTGDRRQEGSDLRTTDSIEKQTHSNMKEMESRERVKEAPLFPKHGRNGSVV
ncbi:hypothetical protein HispidOSU_029383, partial [Sigmodon hispidus]